MRGEMETMVTALVLEERLSRGNDARWGSITFCQKCKIKTTNERRKLGGTELEKMELRKSRRCESATTGRQTHTFEHLAVKKTPSKVFVL
jgi:hypothetical protein